jgi:uncharacterized protein (DUF302 family)
MTTQPVARLGLTVRLNATFDEALTRVVAVLKTEGFGVLTEIDVKGTLRKKLDVDFRPYKILGARNPPLAYRALSAALEVGLLLPCNVTVSYVADNVTEVAIVDPLSVLDVVQHPNLEPVTAEVRARPDRAALTLRV